MYNYVVSRSYASPRSINKQGWALHFTLNKCTPDLTIVCSTNYVLATKILFLSYQVEKQYVLWGGEGNNSFLSLNICFVLLIHVYAGC